MTLTAQLSTADTLHFLPLKSPPHLSLRHLPHADQRQRSPRCQAPVPVAQREHSCYCVPLIDRGTQLTWVIDASDTILGATKQ